MHRAPRTASLRASHSAFSHPCRDRSAKPLDNFRRFAKYRPRTRTRRAPMPRSEPCARVAARSSLSEVDVAAALERGPPPSTTRVPTSRPSPDSGSLAQGPARLAKGAVVVSASRSPSPPSGCRSSRPQRPFPTPSTHSEPVPVDSNSTHVWVAQTRHDKAFATVLLRHAIPETQGGPQCLHSTPCHAAALLSPTGPDRVHVLPRLLRFRLPTRNKVTFRAEGSLREICKLPRVSTYAKSCTLMANT